MYENYVLCSITFEDGVATQAFQWPQMCQPFTRQFVVQCPNTNTRTTVQQITIEGMSFTKKC